MVFRFIFFQSTGARSGLVARAPHVSLVWVYPLFWVCAALSFPVVRLARLFGMRIEEIFLDDAG
jgi:hypothetical protein